MDKVYNMPFEKVYTCLLNKALRKGRTKQEVDEIITWLTGYENLTDVSCTYKEFFENAPHMNPNRTLVKGTVCKIRVEDIQNPLDKDMRILDKLIDELAKGKPMESILRK